MPPPQDVRKRIKELEEQTAVQTSQQLSYKCVELTFNSGFATDIYRMSFLTICDLFGPDISKMIRNRYHAHEAELFRAVEEAREVALMERDPDEDMGEKFFKIELMLQSILCEKYRCVLLWIQCPAPNEYSPSPMNRDLYFLLIAITGSGVFDFVYDYHHQRDNVEKADAEQIDDLVEKLNHAAD